MPAFTDSMGRSIYLPKTPQRIVSVVPSQTELLYDLRLEDEVVGITKFCVHPEHWFRTKTRIGGTKQLNIPLIQALQPDLIIANKEENVKEQIEALAADFPVWISDVNTLEEALHMIEAVGRLTGKDENANRLAQQIATRFKEDLPRIAAPKPKACYLIWREPYMTVGGDTFISHMLQSAGFDNLFQHQTRYPTITLTELQDRGCDILLLSSEPYPFSPKHQAEIAALLPHMPIVLVDGELFSWYGSRLLQAPHYFQQLQQQITAIS